MDKPADLAPWATDANFPAGAEPEAGTPTKVAYTLGQVASGWRPKGRPPARELNTWMNRVGKWIDYVDDGDINGIWGLTGIITPPALQSFDTDGPVDDYAPDDLETANVIRQVAHADGSTLTSLTGGRKGRVITIFNIGGGGGLAIPHNTGPTAENRFVLSGGATLNVTADGSATFWYDIASQRWRLVAKGL